MGRAVHIGADALGDRVRAQQRQAFELASTLAAAECAQAALVSVAAGCTRDFPSEWRLGHKRMVRA